MQEFQVQRSVISQELMGNVFKINLAFEVSLRRPRFVKPVLFNVYAHL